MAARLNWSAPSDGGGAITGYQLERNRSGGGFTLLASPTGLTHLDSGAVDGDVYRVRAVNANGVGPWSGSGTYSSGAPRSGSAAGSVVWLGSASGAQPSSGAISWGWEVTSSNVGLAAVGVDRTTLPTYSGGTPVAGQTITLQRITQSYNLSSWLGNTPVANVTFDRCWFDVPLERSGQFGPNNQLIDCDFIAPGNNSYGPMGRGSTGSPAVFTRCRISGYQIPVWVEGPTTLDTCYIEAVAVGHAEAIRSGGGNFAVVVNKCNVRITANGASACLFYEGNSSGYNHFDSIFDVASSDATENLGVSQGGAFGFTNCRVLGGANNYGTSTFNPWSVWWFNAADPINGTDGGRKGALIPDPG